MEATEILVDWIEELARNVQEQVEGLSLDELTWRPDNEANSVGITVWHFSRWLDLLTVRALKNNPPEEEQWFMRGWARKTGYDPRGIGYASLGALTGYTQEEVSAVPMLAAADLLAYLHQVCDALLQHLRAMPVDALFQLTPGLGGKRSPYQWVKPILMGCFGHVGEIECLKAMRARRVASSTSLSGNAPAAL